MNSSSTDLRLAGDTTISARAAQPPLGCPGVPAGVQTMAEVVAHINRPTHGVIPAAAAPTVAAGDDVEPNPAALAQVQRLVRQLDDRRLLSGIPDRRFAGESVALAVEAFEHYDPRQHHLSHLGADHRQPAEMSYPAFFRLVAGDTFAVTRNIGLAGLVLDRLIAERAP